MKSPALFAAAVALLTASAGEARAPLRGPEIVPDCTLTVAFSSYGAGIDNGARVRIEQLVRADRGVRAFSPHPWGREGEVNLCVLTRTNADAVRLSRRIRALIPAHPRGPIRVELPFMRRD
jgi:hypothetical protein